MDENKVKKYEELGYKIAKVCGNCIHSRFTPHTVWGTCSKYTYEHLKHAEAERNLSIHKFGVCPFAELDLMFVDTLGKYKILTEDKK